MAYYGKRRYDPRADERRARDAKVAARLTRDKRRLSRLLGAYTKVALTGKEAQDAWGQKELRSYSLAQLSNGDMVTSTIRGDGKHIYLQEVGGIGWNFYKLVRKPKKRKKSLKRLKGGIVLKRPKDYT